MNHFPRVITVVLVCLASATLLHSQQVFEVNLNDRSGDSFKVTLHPEQLSASDSIYQFAATAPGTYQVMDIGRFVSNFKAYDGAGRQRPGIVRGWIVCDESANFDRRG